MISIPKLPDIQEGLFKLILFSNLDDLILNNRSVPFIAKLKLTGNNIIGSLTLPASSRDIEEFLRVNFRVFNEKEKQIIKKLDLEAVQNRKLKIEISSNS